MTEFPTDTEAEVLAAAAEDALFRVHEVLSSCDGQMEARIIAAELAPLIRAREAAARAAGRSELIKAMRDATYEAEAECAGRFAARLNRQEADDDRD